MSAKTQIDIPRDLVYQAAEVARECSSEAARERVLVSQAVALAIRDQLEQAFQITTEVGRSGESKYVDLLDICDFKVNNWRVEVRTLTKVKELALYVPTTPLMVGILSDFYLCAQVDPSLTHAEVLGYAARQDLAEADLSANGLFAILPVEELRPFASVMRIKG